MTHPKEKYSRPTKSEVRNFINRAWNKRVFESLKDLKITRTMKTCNVDFRIKGAETDIKSGVAIHTDARPHIMLLRLPSSLSEEDRTRVARHLSKWRRSVDHLGPYVISKGIGDGGGRDVYHIEIRKKENWKYFLRTVEAVIVNIVRALEETKNSLTDGLIWR